jgi:hypothetical protein
MSLNKHIYKHCLTVFQKASSILMTENTLFFKFLTWYLSSVSSWNTWQQHSYFLNRHTPHNTYYKVIQEKVKQYFINLHLNEYTRTKFHRVLPVFIIVIIRNGNFWSTRNNFGGVYIEVHVAILNDMSNL